MPTAPSTFDATILSFGSTRPRTRPLRTPRSIAKPLLYRTKGFIKNDATRMKLLKDAIGILQQIRVEFGEPRTTPDSQVASALHNAQQNLITHTGKAKVPLVAIRLAQELVQRKA